MKLKTNKKIILKISVLLTILVGLLGFVDQLNAASPPGTTTAPYLVTYTAKLMSSTGTPVTTAQDVRFSLWKDSDWTAANVDLAGNIDITSANYAGWQETHTVTPNSDGIFSVQLGSINTFPNFTLGQQVYLEVDVKPQTSPNTSFEVLDPDGDVSNLTDRKPFNSVPYSINADTVDNRDADNSPNNIPVLDGSGKLVYGVIPDAVNADTFTLDVDNNAPGNVVTLQFGQALAQYLRWNNPANTFEFSSNLNINGNLNFSGSGQISGATIDGTLNTLQNIPHTAIAPYSKQTVLSPKYPNSILSPDGSDNDGRLSTEYENSGPGSHFNYYLWTTNLATSQDMDIVVRYQLPADFVSFSATPITLNYQTADTNLANNSLDVSLSDSAGTPVVLSGASSLSSTGTWSTASINIAGAPTFTPGSIIELTIHAAALNGGKFVKIGDLTFNYEGR
jgi:hypothetical protein